MMIVYDHPPTISMTIDSLTPLEASVHESITLQSPNELPDGKVPKLFIHIVTATAGRSMTSIFPDSTGIGSPASIISST